MICCKKTRLVFASLFSVWVLFSFPAFAVDDDEAWDTIRQALFSDKVIADGSGLLTIETPYRALDAAIVPITINALVPQTKDRYIKSLTLTVDQNPDPIAAVFHFTPDNGSASISTRVRIDAYTYVRAIAETSDGKLHMVANFVKAAGGCSAPSLSGMEEAEKVKGNMKLKVLGMPDDQGSGKAKFMIRHPNYSGLQFNQISRTEIPANFINDVQVSLGDDVLMTMDMGNSISEDPTVIFHFAKKNEPFKIFVGDLDGKTYEKSWPASGLTSTSSDSDSKS
ncbi:MAG: quinoprotein dehydrogenase-associated SoxYZ-like carrier [Rickettsiales bacterium]|nr:quinoprotein dehydrogenase-associated SoxYZ-like carrier [Rickettsiales bacterium]